MAMTLIGLGRALKRISKPQLKEHKPRFNEECLGFLGQKKQTTMQ